MSSLQTNGRKGIDNTLALGKSPGGRSKSVRTSRKTLGSILMLGKTNMPRSRDWRCTVAGLALAPICAVALTGPAAAHAWLDRDVAKPNAQYEGTLIIPHGCQVGDVLKPTVKIQARLPMDLSEVSAEPTGDWKPTITKLPTGFTEIVWEGGKLAPDAALSLKVKAKVADLPNGRVLFLPTVQTCEDGAVSSWIDIPEPGKSDSSVAFPCPQLTVTNDKKHDSSGEGGHMHHH